MGFLNPEKLMPVLDIHEGMSVADFGSGSGYFSVLAARQVGNSGRVCAIDIQESALESVRSRARLANLFNVQTVRANVEVPQSSRLSDGSQDRVFVHNVLFQSDNKTAVLQEAFRVLKSGGMVAVIEWVPEKYPSDRTQVHLISKLDMKSLLESVGFVNVKDFLAGAYHYGLMAKKQ